MIARWLGGSEVKFAANLLTALGRADLIELCRLPPGPGQAPVREFLRDNAPDDPDPAITNWGQIAYDAWAMHGGTDPVDMAEVEMPITGVVECPEPPPEDAGPTMMTADAGTDAGPTTAPPGDDGGCGCRVPAAKATESWRGIAATASGWATPPPSRLTVIRTRLAARRLRSRG